MFTFREEYNEEAAGGGEQLTTDEGVLATEPVQSVHGHQHSGHHEHACHIQNTFSLLLFQHNIDICIKGTTFRTNICNYSK